MRNTSYQTFIEPGTNVIQESQTIDVVKVEISIDFFSNFFPTDPAT